MSRRGIGDKDKVLILQRILMVKGLLYGESHSVLEKNSEWKKIADYAENELNISGRDFKYFKGPFMYGCKTSLARRLMRKNIPMTRAHLLTMDIIGKDSLKLVPDLETIPEHQERASSNEMDTSTPLVTKKVKSEGSPKRGSSESESDDEIHQMKRRKLQLDIEYRELLLNKEKEKEKEM